MEDKLLNPELFLKLKQKGNYAYKTTVRSYFRKINKNI